MGEGDEILVPAYHHGSELEALLRAGATCRFYEVDETLVPNAAELESLLSDRTRALYLIHYYGFPQEVNRWRRWCDERKLLLVEDVAQSWLARIDDTPLGFVGDISIFCLYKTFGLPDGAAVVCNEVVDPPESEASSGLSRTARRHASWLIGRSAALQRIGEARAAPLTADKEFEWTDARPASAATCYLLPRVVDERAAEIRRENYESLLEALGERVPHAFAELPDGAVPLIFPIEGADDERLIARLRARGVDAGPFWPILHPAFPAHDFPGAARWRARLVALPVHQELRASDLRRIATAVRGSARRRLPNLRADTVETLEPLEEDWRRLACDTGNIFMTWEWASTWWKHFGKEGALRAFVYRNGGARPVGIVPLYEWTRGPIRVLRLVGHGPADQLGPICGAEDRARIGRALRCSLDDRLLRWHVFVGERLPREDGWSSLLRAPILGIEPNPVLPLDCEWDALLERISSGFRYEIRSKERKFMAKHNARFRLSAGRQLDGDLDLLFKLHAARWGLDSAFLAMGRAAFHREFAHRAFDEGWLRLWLLEVEDQAVAAWYGFRFEGVEYFYQGGRDLSWSRSSVGLIVLVNAIRSACEDGMREFRFLRGGEEYKYRFAPGDAGVETVGWGNGRFGQAALVSAVSLHNVRRTLRHLSSRVAP